jgi:hypothetical protein
MEWMDYLEFIARVASHIPDKGQITVRYYGLYANAHRGKTRKANLVAFALGMVEEEPSPIPGKVGPIWSARFMRWTRSYAPGAAGG